MEIRQARGEGELEVARRLFREYAAELNLDVCFKGFEEELSGLPGPYGPPDGRLLLLWVEDRPAGCAAVRKVDGNLCEMKRLYLKPEFRGSGRGRTLTLTLLREASALGYRRMRLETLPVMQVAVEMYRSLGFRPVDNPHTAGGDGVMHLEVDLVAFPPRTSLRNAR